MENSDLRNSVFVPAGQALITGLFAAGFIAALFNLQTWPGIALAVGCGCAFLAWLLSLDQQRKIINAAAGLADPGQDEQVSYQHQPITRIELVQDAGRSVSWLDVPCSIRQLQQLARGVAAGSSLSINAWTGSARPFTRSEFEALRNELISRGLAEDLGSNRGLQLTAAGRGVFRHFV